MLLFLHLLTCIKSQSKREGCTEEEENRRGYAQLSASFDRMLISLQHNRRSSRARRNREGRLYKRKGLYTILHRRRTTGIWVDLLEHIDLEYPSMQSYSGPSDGNIATRCVYIIMCTRTRMALSTNIVVTIAFSNTEQIWA